MQALLPVHIVAGGLAVVLGAVALVVAKGGTVHRQAGLLFVYAMLTMGISAAILGNVGGGLTASYFVITALTTVRPASAFSRRVNLAALILAGALIAFDIAGGIRSIGSPRFMLNGVPAPMFFFLGGVMLAAAVGDIRVLRGAALRGKPRIRRHLWRMCFALFIAAGSFFSIRARVARILPEPFLSAPMRALPILLVFAAMFYWMWRFRSTVEAASAARRVP